MTCSSPSSFTSGGVPFEISASPVQPQAAAVLRVNSCRRCATMCRASSEKVRIVPCSSQVSGMTLLQSPACRSVTATVAGSVGGRS